MALNFPAKIYLILENESADVIKWHPNGMAFRIVDHGRFEREIIPKYFRHNQLSSVQRQLNLYGFKCINRGEDKGAFYHPRFKRGDWEVVKKITRYSPTKKSGESSQYGDKPNDNFEGFDYLASDTQPFANNSIPDGSFPHSTIPAVPPSYGNQAYGFPHFQLDSSVNTSWYPMYSHLGYNIPMDFHHGTHFVSSFVPASTAVADQSAISNSDTISSNAADSSAMSLASTDSNPTEQVPVKEETIFKTENKKKPFVHVVNDIVSIDPYFDLDAELDIFHDAGLSSSSMMYTNSNVFASKTHNFSVSKREMGVNTDLSMANCNVSDLNNISTGQYL